MEVSFHQLVRAASPRPADQAGEAGFRISHLSVAGRNPQLAHRSGDSCQNWPLAPNGESPLNSAMSDNAPSMKVPDMAPFNETNELKRLAVRVRQARRQRNWTQPELASRAGVALRTYKRFEQSGTGSMETLVRVVHALERLAALELLFSAALAQGSPRATSASAPGALASVSAGPSRPAAVLQQRVALLQKRAESRPPQPGAPA